MEWKEFLAKIRQCNGTGQWAFEVAEYLLSTS